MVALGADHGGFEIKESIRLFLKKHNIPYFDFGTYDMKSVDYPEFAKKVAKSVTSGESQFGILCCGTGIGISIAANKIHGIRAAVCTNEFCAEMSRRHNDANILCLGGRVIDSNVAIKLAEIFLRTPFDGGRHKNRVDQITQIEGC